MQGDVIKGDQESGMESPVHKEGGNSCSGMGHVVVGELSDGKLLLPVILYVICEHSDILLQSLVETLGLSISFRMICY